MPQAHYMEAVYTSSTQPVVCGPSAWWSTSKGYCFYFLRI